MKPRSLIILLAVLMILVRLFSASHAHAQTQGGIILTPNSAQPQIYPNAGSQGVVSGASPVAGVNSTATQTLLSAPGANLYIWVRQANCVNSSSVATDAALMNGSTPIWHFSCPP